MNGCIAISPWDLTRKAVGTSVERTYACILTGGDAQGRRQSAAAHVKQQLETLKRKNTRLADTAGRVEYSEAEGVLTCTLRVTVLGNAHRISVERALENEGFTLGEWLVSNEAQDSVMPACCDEGCQVEPDGRCEHGCPSIALALGVI
jgi:hypothetical protein